MRNRVSSCVSSTLLVAALASPAWADVYASGVQQTGINSLSYILNENANVGVNIEVWKVGGGLVYSENLGAQSAGTQNWMWNGTGYIAGDTYTVKINPSSTGYANWTKLSTDNPLNSFFSPRGVDVSRDPGSQYFGRVYVSESVGGAPTVGVVRGAATQDGVYMLNADGTDAVGQGNTARNGGVAWGGTNSPFRLTVGPEQKVYLTDWSDAHSGLWVGDADFNSAVSVFDNTNRAASGLTANHGSISSVYVEGTGANRVVYTMDEDYPGATNQRGSITRYNVGTVAQDYAGLPSYLYDDLAAGNLVQNYTTDFVRASDGTWWVSQERAGGTDTLMSLMQLSADGQTVLWKSVPSLGATSAADPLRHTRGIAYDPVNDWIACAQYATSGFTGRISILDAATKAILYTIELGTTATPRDVAFDAVGNLYLVDNGLERLQIWSPPTGANSFSTESWFSIIPEPATIGLLLLGSLPLLRRRRIG